MRLYKINLEINGKYKSFTVRGINMIQLVAQCERYNKKYTVVRLQN